MLNSLEDVSWASSKIRLAFPYSGDFKSSNPNFAFLDFDKIQFPLTIRAWKPGDDFRPFGMRGRKKVSDYLIDCKRSMPQKEKTKVLCQGEQIVWLIGERIDQNFAIQINTYNILKLEFYGDN
jgi:tRNA(Ile)-lysidine synthase